MDDQARRSERMERELLAGRPLNGGATGLYLDALKESAAGNAPVESHGAEGVMAAPLNAALTPTSQTLRPVGGRAQAARREN